MKLHTSLTAVEVTALIRQAVNRGHLTPDVHAVVFTPGSSRTHRYGYEVQLGTYDKHSLPPGTTDQHGKHMRVRRFKNTGTRGANSDSEWAGNEGIWAATWHEWGWFIAEVFAADPGARFGADPSRCQHPQCAWGYSSPEDFARKTDGEFPLPDSPPPAPECAAHRDRRNPVGFEAAAARPSADDTLARIDDALAGPSLDPAVFGPQDQLASPVWA